MTVYKNPPNQSKGILDDYAVRKNIATREGTIEKTPTNSKDIVNKAYALDLLISGTGVWKDPVLDKDLSTPPANPSKGDRYIVSAGISGGWYDENWGYRQKITIDHTKVESNQANFTVIILITDSGNPIFEHAKSNGYDTIVTSSDKTTKLEHELISYDATVGSKFAQIAVKIPTLSSSTDTDIYLYYGNDTIVDDPSTTDTWDSDYVLVQHLKDLTSTTTKDSTGNGFNGTKYTSTMPSETTGKLGKGQLWNRKGYIDVGTDSKLRPSDITLEAWAKANTMENWMGIISNMVSWGTGFSLQMGTHQRIAAMISGAYLRTSWSPVTNKWYYISATHDDGTNANKLYVAGTQENTSTRAVSYNAGNTTRIGVFYTTGSLAFNGILDEIRVSKVVRSADYMKTTYNNLNDNSSFVSFGQEERPEASGAWAGYETYLAEWNGSSWEFEGAPTDGWTCSVTDEDKIYSFTSGSWSPTEANTNHNQLLNLQGGQKDEYYHTTEGQHAAIIRDATNALNGLMPAGKLDSWDGKAEVETSVNIDDGDSPYTPGDETYIIADTSSDTVTINLPTASGLSGKRYFIKNIDGTNTAEVVGDGTEKIDDLNQQDLVNQYDSLNIVSDGTQWWIISKNF